MPGKTFQVFIKEVFDKSIEICGKEYSQQLNALRQERERLLRDSWREVPPQDLSSAEQEQVFREIDFDTIVMHSARFLEEPEYLAFLYDVAETAIGYTEFGKAQRLLTLITDHNEEVAGTHLLGKAHHQLGYVAWYQSEYPTAEREYRKGLSSYKTVGDTSGIVAIKNLLGILMVEQGMADKGLALFTEAKNLAAEIDSPRDLLLRINYNMGNIYTIHGEWDQAMSCYQEALDIVGEDGDEKLQAQFFHNMAIIYKWQGDNEKALEFLQKSIKHSTSANNPHEKALAYLDEAEIHCQKGDYSSSTSLATTAFQIFSELGDRLSMADVYKVFGMINRESKRYDLALSYFENSLRINKDYNNPLNMGETYYELGKYYSQKSEPEEARKSFESALEYLEVINAKAKIEMVKKAIADIK